jgi:hypothetical protein
MINDAVNDVKTLFKDMSIIDLDVGKEINTHGNYLVFEKFKPDEMMESGVFTFTLFMALKSLKRGKDTAYADLDDVITALGNAGQENIVCECTNMQLSTFSKRLFIYAITLNLHRSW